MTIYIYIYIYIYISGSLQHIVLAKGKSVKIKGDDHHDSCIRMEDKVKDRPFTEGSRGFHVLLGLDAQNFNAKERHFILPLVYEPLLCSLSLLFLPYHMLV